MRRRKSRKTYVWSEEEDAKLTEAAKEGEDAATKAKYWESVMEAVMPYRSAASVQQRARILGLKAKLHGAHTICVQCDETGVFNRKRKLCRPCYGKLKENGVI